MFTDIPWKVLGSGQRNADLGIRVSGINVNCLSFYLNGPGRLKSTSFLSGKAGSLILDDSKSNLVDKTNG